MKAYWNCEAEELKKNFQVSEEGLLPAQVEAIRREKGENVLQEGKRKSVAAVFAQQFCDLLVVILIIAAVISMFSGNVESTVVILLVLVMNAVLGTVQHVKAERSLESLKKLSRAERKSDAWRNQAGSSFKGDRPRGHCSFGGGRHDRGGRQDLT